MAEPSAAATPAWPPRAPGRRALRWGAVLLAHALLVLLWRSALGPVQVSVTQRPDEHVLQLLALRPAVPPPIPKPAPRAATMAPAVKLQVATPRPARAAETPVAPPLPAPAAESTLSLLPEPPASAPKQARLLDSIATRQAIRDAARSPLLSERTATATGIAPVTAAERLSKDAAAAGKGDCGKGEFTGAGMGLLSLPFLAAAVATGQCAR